MHDYKKFLPLLFITVLLFCLFANNTVTYAATATLNPSTDSCRDAEGNIFPIGDTGNIPGYAVNWVGSYASISTTDSKSYTKFDLSSISGTVTSATFRIYVKQTDGSPFVNLYGSNVDDWIEDLDAPASTNTTIPTQDVPIVTNDTTGISLNAWKTFDVTSFVNSQVAGDKTATFVLTGNTSGDNDFAYCAEEDTTYKPILEVTYVLPATVTSVGVPSNGTYGTGQNLDFMVNFSDTVTVNTDGGTPYIPITLDTGGTVNAGYISGSGTNALAFRYTVAAGNSDPTGIAVGAAITANGATLRDSVGNNVNLTLNGGDTTGVLVKSMAYTAMAYETTSGPTAGVDNAITLTVKDSFGNTDTTFTGAHDVTISGYTAAPDSSYGSFNGTALTASPNTISVTFAGGVASSNLALNNASAQTIAFSVADVNTPATNNLSITPVPAVAATMALTQDITAPAANGGQFAQQPKVTLKDAFGNICTNDSATVVTASKKDAGSWTLTGTATATASAGVATFAGLGATNAAAITGAQLAFDATGLTQITSSAVNLPAPAGAWTATASAATTGPNAGANDAITLTVKDSLGNTDTTFIGAHDVTISGYEAAPDGSYGSFYATALAASPNTISVTFTNGVASPNLALNNASAQTIGFSIAGVNTPATNTVTITPVPAVAYSMNLTQDITAPAANGGQFAQQPRVTLKDAFGNTCTNDSATVVTASKKDAGSWTLTGTATATASAGVVTFTNLGATNTAAVTGAQLAFDATGLPQITSSSVNLPEPAGAWTAIASAATTGPDAGANDAITLTVKDSLGNTDTTFTGAHDVTISGYTAAPDSSYGSFNATALTASPNTISVTFAGGVASPNLALNNALAQTIAFSVADVNTPATNNVSITPVPAVAATMALTQDITAPAANGGQFAQQPRVTLKDAFGNICTNDSATVVTASKKDAGSWTLTGTATATASTGVATFAGLGATNTAAVTGAQLAFDATGLPQITSSSVNLPAPAGAWTATASAATTGPDAGVNNTVILTVKDSLGNTDITFTGSHNVTVSGYTAAPDGSYGSFYATALAASPNTISVTFAGGVASPNLALNNASAQTIAFSVADVNTPATNNLSITPVPAVAATMALTQDITAPAANGGQFAQQPKVTLKDAFGNTCTNDSSTVVTASKKDAGSWTLTGTATATASAGVVTFTNLGATNTAAVTGAQLAFDATGLPQITSSAVNLPEPAGAYTATASAALPGPNAGVNNAITLMVKDSLGNTDITFTGSHNVTVSGYTAAPDGSYGSFNATALAASPNTISVTFTNGVASSNLALSNASAQTIAFSVAGVTTPATNNLSITPVPAVAASMALTQDITAPTANGGQFAQQPRVTLKDAFGNICTNDSATVVTASKKDAGSWTLTGTATATASAGVVTFTNLGATNTAAVTGAQLAFDATGLPQLTSSSVNLPEPTLAGLAITTGSLPSGTVGTPYSTTLTATGGTAPYTWSATGLPQGLSITTGGVISGNPGAAGTSTVTATVYDSGSQNASASFSLRVNTAPSTLTVTTGSLPSGTVGASYSATLTATGGTTPYTWSATGLPSGLSLDTVTGQVYGTPTVPVISTVVVTVHDSSSNSSSTGFNLSIAIPIVSSIVDVATDGSNKNLGITTSTPDTTVNIPGSVTDATINVGSLLNSVAGSVYANLPSINLNAITSISTNPVQVSIPAGTTVSADSSANWDGTIHVPTVQANNTVTVTPDPGKNAVVDKVIEVGFGDVPLTFNRAVRILFPDQAGKIVGYYRAGNFTKITTVLSADTQAAGDALPPNGEGRIDVGSDLVIWTKHFTRYVIYTQTATSSGGGGGGSNHKQLAINTLSLSDATVGQPYTITIFTNGKGAAPYTFSISGGAMPNGLSLSSSTGEISGTPAAPGSYDFTITVNDANNNTASQKYTLKVHPSEEKPVQIGLTDISEHWAEKNIERLVAMGAIAGYPDGTFKPDKTITRAEFATVLVKAFKLAPKTGIVFADTAEHWAKDYIETAASYGIVNGYDSVTFGPDELITREQMAVMAVKAAKLSPANEQLSFSDSGDISVWAKEAVATVVKVGIMKGYPDNSFGPGADATRAEAVTIIVNTLNK